MLIMLGGIDGFFSFKRISIDSFVTVNGKVTGDELFSENETFTLFSVVAKKKSLLKKHRIFACIFRIP